MKVYSLQESDYDSYYALGIFSTKEKAIEAILNRYPNASDISIIHKKEDSFISFKWKSIPLDDSYDSYDSYDVGYYFSITEFTLDEIT